MLKKLKGNGGFTLLEVLLVVALLGIFGSMLLPSLDGAAGKAKNAKLASDLTTLDNALLLYKMDEGTYPEGLDALVGDYIGKGKELKDASGEEFVYTPGGDKMTYTLSGKNAEGETVTSDGSSPAGA